MFAARRWSSTFVPVEKGEETVPPISLLEEPEGETSGADLSGPLPALAGNFASQSSATTAAQAGVLGVSTRALVPGVKPVNANAEKEAKIKTNHSATGQVFCSRREKNRKEAKLPSLPRSDSRTCGWSLPAAPMIAGARSLTRGRPAKRRNSAVGPGPSSVAVPTPIPGAWTAKYSLPLLPLLPLTSLKEIGGHRSCSSHTGPGAGHPQGPLGADEEDLAGQENRKDSAVFGYQLRRALQ